MTTLSIGSSLAMAGIPSGSVLIVSPHLDDAVFSCGALLDREEPLDVVTVCTGAPDPPVQGWWDADCGFASSADSVPARRREDDAAFEGLPHRRDGLGLLELQYRERRSAEEDARIVDWIADWAASNPSGTVAVPAGAGCSQRLAARWRRRVLRESCSPPQHPDHVWVRDTVVRALEAASAALLLYEEVPYLWGEPADAEAKRVARRGGYRHELLVLPVDRDRKAARIRAYASQIPHISPSHGRLDDPETLPGNERYWLLSPGTTSA
jgi:LmbE family N-acetylglucosaminyl deacetylase